MPLRGLRSCATFVASMKKILCLLLATVALVHAQIEPGQKAPDFKLLNTEGKQTSLADFKGKVVVLEWVNHGCPFVKKHYAPGNMQNLQKDAVAKGVVWLSICSSAPEKQGHMTGADAAKFCDQVKSNETAYLLDEDGKVGRLYGAKCTPEMYVINASGVVAYHGAIDDKKSTDSADIAGSKNHVRAALDEVLANKPVSLPKTLPYGCSVKYAN